MILVKGYKYAAIIIAFGLVCHIKNFPSNQSHSRIKILCVRQAVSQNSWALPNWSSHNYILFTIMYSAQGGHFNGWHKVQTRSYSTIYKRFWLSLFQTLYSTNLDTRKLCFYHQQIQVKLVPLLPFVSWPFWLCNESLPVA